MKDVNKECLLRIHSYMRANGITQMAVGDAAGISQPTVSGMLSGRVRPDKIIRVLVEKFGADEKELRGEAVAGWEAITSLPGYESATAIERAEETVCGVSAGDYVILREESPQSFIQFGRTYVVETKSGARMMRVISEDKKGDGFVRLSVPRNAAHDQTIAISDIGRLFSVVGVVKRM